MCKEIYSRIEYGDKQKAKYDAKGLFIHTVKTYCDEESNRCKKVFVIVQFHGICVDKNVKLFIFIFGNNFFS